MDKMENNFIDWNMFMPDKITSCCIKIRDNKRAYIDSIDSIKINYISQPRSYQDGRAGLIEGTKYPFISYAAHMNDEAKQILSELYIADNNYLLVTIKNSFFEIDHKHVFPCIVRTSYNFLRNNYGGREMSNNIKIDIVFDDTDITFKRNLREMYRMYIQNISVGNDELTREELLDI